MTTVGVPTLPTRLAERYEAGPVVGRGVGSVVFRAHDTLLGRDAAVKSFRVESDPRAGRELSLLARFDHPGLVPVYDVEERDGRAFVVMALLDGGSLTDRIAAAGGGLGLAEALRTAATVGGALEHLHRAGVTHRGVGPANVLYDGDGRAHLSDFGVALVADAPRITDTGLTVGAAPYLAPEQVRGEQAGPAADVYALALVLIESLTGRRAFPGDPLSAAQARLDRRPVLPDGLDDDVASLLTAMTAADPADRPDATAVSAVLRRALVEAEPATSVVAAPALSVSGPATRVGVGPLALVGGALARHGGTSARRGAPRATGTRGVLVLAGLAASAVLAGTVAIATSGPVAEVSADDRPAVVAGGATVGAPDPQGVPQTPAIVVPPSSEPAPTRDATTTTRPPDPRTVIPEEPVRRVALPETSTPEPTRATPTTRTTPEPTEEPEPTAQVEERPAQPEPTRRPGAVGQVLNGVGGLLGGVLGGGR